MNPTKKKIFSVPYACLFVCDICVQVICITVERISTKFAGCVLILKEKEEIDKILVSWGQRSQKAKGHYFYIPITMGVDPGDGGIEHHTIWGGG